MESVTDMVADCSVAQLLAMQAVCEPDKIGLLGVSPAGSAYDQAIAQARDAADFYKQKQAAVNYRLATLHNELHLCTAFSRMLRELEPLGHDVLPTDTNVDLFWTHIFKRALLEGRHGMVLAFAGDACVGATFFTPEYTDIQTPPGRAIAHGAWVHPDYRQQGVAWRMQAMAHGHLSQLGFTSLISNVVAANTAGLASCKAAGASVVGYMTSVSLAVEGVS